MHKLASFNGRLTELSDASLSAAGLGCLFGKGVFTTMAIYDGRPFQWERHWRRISYHAERIGIDASEFAEDAAISALTTLIKTNEVAAGRARITFFDETASGLWPFDVARNTSLLIMTADFLPVPDPVRLTISPYRLNTRSPIAGIKSSNHLENLIALKEAKVRGFNECIQLNERGEISSASMANVFWCKDGRLCTPSVATGCLAGTTREFVIENLECEEVTEGIEHLGDADKIFLTSAGIGVLQVAEFDGRVLEMAPHPITGLLPTRP